MRLILSLCLLVLCGCGDTRTASAPLSRHEVEHDHPGWEVERVEPVSVLVDVGLDPTNNKAILQPRTITKVTYRDYHWTWEAGYLHPAEHPTYYYDASGQIVSVWP